MELLCDLSALSHPAPRIRPGSHPAKRRICRAQRGAVIQSSLPCVGASGARSVREDPSPSGDMSHGERTLGGCAGAVPMVGAGCRSSPRPRVHPAPLLGARRVVLPLLFLPPCSQLKHPSSAGWPRSLWLPSQVPAAFTTDPAKENHRVSGRNNGWA